MSEMIVKPHSSETRPDVKQFDAVLKENLKKEYGPTFQKTHCKSPLYSKYSTSDLALAERLKERLTLLSKSTNFNSGESYQSDLKKSVNKNEAESKWLTNPERMSFAYLKKTHSSSLVIKMPYAFTEPLSNCVENPKLHKKNFAWKDLNTNSLLTKTDKTILDRVLKMEQLEEESDDSNDDKTKILVAVKTDLKNSSLTKIKLCKFCRRPTCENHCYETFKRRPWSDNSKSKKQFEEKSLCINYKCKNVKDIPCPAYASKSALQKVLITTKKCKTKYTRHHTDGWVKNLDLQL